MSTDDIGERLKTLKTLKEQMAACAAAGRKAEELLAIKAVPQTQQMLQDAIHAGVVARLKQAAKDAARRKP